MTWLGDFGGDLGGQDWSEGAASYARGSILGAAARAGWSGRQALSAIRSAGVGVGSSSFWPMWNGIRDQIGRNQTASALAYDASTGEVLPGEAPEGWTGRYVHQVTATFRTREPSGEYSVTQKTLGVVAGRPLTPLEATQAAMDILTTPSLTNEEGESPDVSNMLSMQLTGAWYQVHRPARAA